MPIPAKASSAPRCWSGPRSILTSVVLACGLAVTVFSDLPSLRLFGWLTAFAMLAALVADLTDPAADHDVPYPIVAKGRAENGSRLPLSLICFSESIVPAYGIVPRRAHALNHEGATDPPCCQSAREDPHEQHSLSDHRRIRAGCPGDAAGYAERARHRPPARSSATAGSPQPASSTAWRACARPARRISRRAAQPDRGGGRGGARRLPRTSGCDGIVALGGGSPIDLAKGVALLATHAGPLEQLCGDLWRHRRRSPPRSRR